MEEISLQSVVHQDNVSQEIDGRDISIVRPDWFMYGLDNIILDHFMYTHVLMFFITLYSIVFKTE